MRQNLRTSEVRSSSTKVWQATSELRRSNCRSSGVVRRDSKSSAEPRKLQSVEITEARQTSPVVIKRAQVRGIFDVAADFPRQAASCWSEPPSSSSRRAMLPASHAHGTRSQHAVLSIRILPLPRSCSDASWISGMSACDQGFGRAQRGHSGSLTSSGGRRRASLERGQCSARSI